MLLSRRVDMNRPTVCVQLHNPACEYAIWRCGIVYYSQIECNIRKRIIRGTCSFYEQVYQTRGEAHQSDVTPADQRLIRPQVHHGVYIHWSIKRHRITRHAERISTVASPLTALHIYELDQRIPDRIKREKRTAVKQDDLMSTQRTYRASTASFHFTGASGGHIGYTV